MTHSASWNYSFATGVLALVWFSALGTAGAQTTRTWNGSVSTDWSNPNNWTPVGVPAANDTINFTGGTINRTAPVTIGGHFHRSRGTLSGNPLTISSNGVLNITGPGSLSLLGA